jgi:hypothetical protein
MNIKSFRKFLDRDGGCVHCGETEAVAPHHRINRGMGGSKKLDTANNILVMCSTMNTAMESSERYATMARLYGWKLRPWEDPAKTPFWHAIRLGWFLLGDDFRYTEVPDFVVPEELKEYF